MNKFRWPWQKHNKSVAFAVDYGKGTVVWASDDYRKFMNESFVINVIAFQCTNIIARAVSSAKWAVQTETADGEFVTIDDPQMRQLLKRVNPFDTWSFLLYKSICYLLCNGNTYLQGVKTSFSKSIPKELWNLRPDLMKVQMNKNSTMIENYIYTPELLATLSGVSIDNKLKGDSIVFPVDPITGVSDILHIKSFNPFSDIYGMPTIKPIGRDIDISNAAQTWNMSLMQNEARPGMIVMLKGHLGEDAFKALKAQLDTRHTGADNAGKSLILESDDGIVDVKPYSFSPKDVEFLEGGRETARRIAMGFGVPSQMLGIPGDSTYSNYKEARSAFYEDTVSYYFNLYSEAFTHWIYGADINNKKYIKPVLDSIPAFAEQKAAIWERIKMVDFLTDNEKRKIVGFKTYGPSGDYLWKTSGLIPITEDTIDEMLAPIDESIPEDQLPVNEPAEEDPETIDDDTEDKTVDD